MLIILNLEKPFIGRPSALMLRTGYGIDRTDQSGATNQELHCAIFRKDLNPLPNLEKATRYVSFPKNAF